MATQTVCNSFAEFRNRIEPDNALHPDIVGAAQSLMTAAGDCYAPSGMLMAIAEAGYLATNPNIQLANAPIPAIPAEATAAVILRGIINSSIEPSAARSGVYQMLCPRSIVEPQSCSYAEISFTHLLAFLGNSSQTSRVVKSDIFIDEQAEPVFLRKYKGEFSAMALYPFIMSGIEFPAGSLVRLETYDELRNPQLQDGDYEFIPKPKEITRILPIRTIGGLSFKRLLAYALPPDERANEFRFDISQPKVDANEELLLNRGMDDVRDIVRRAARAVLAKGCTLPSAS